MKITFVKHSCYTVESKNYYLVFDYIGGELNIPKDKKVIFFSTHRHADHFSEEIFKIKADYYVLSDDIETNPPENTLIVSPDNEYNLFDLLIKTTGSTDEGVAFYVKGDDFAVIHAGDLNHWVWDRYTKEDRDHMKVWFESEVDKFKDLDVDVVMMVVDPRMKDSYDLTGKYFLENTSAKYYFPMHMWEDFNLSQKFKDKYQDKFKDKIIMTVEHDNQEFDLKI